MNFARVWPLCAAIFASACATTHNLTPLGLETSPAAKVREDAKIDSAQYATFSVFPVSIAKGDAKIKGTGHEASVLFSLRNAFEARGYRFVPIDESPDLLVTVDVFSSLLAQFDPKNPPKPGNVSHLTDSGLAASGALDAVARKSLAAYEFGSLPPGHGGADPLPGNFPLKIGRKPRPVLYGTRVTVAVLDNATLTEIWTAAGTGASRVPDLRINSQSVLWAVLDLFPPAATTRLHAQTAGIGGLNMEIATIDGERYYPAILDMDKGSPGWRSGLKPFDIILAVAGEETKNDTLESVRNKMEGPKGSEIYLTVWRMRVSDQLANPIDFLMRKDDHMDNEWMQINCSVTRKAMEAPPVQPKRPAQEILPMRPYYEIPYEVQEGARMCILPAVGCAVIGAIISTALAGGG